MAIGAGTPWAGDPNAGVPVVQPTVSPPPPSPTNPPPATQPPSPTSPPPPGGGGGGGGGRPPQNSLTSEQLFALWQQRSAARNAFRQALADSRYQRGLLRIDAMRGRKDITRQYTDASLALPGQLNSRGMLYGGVAVGAKRGLNREVGRARNDLNLDIDMRRGQIDSRSDLVAERDAILNQLRLLAQQWRAQNATQEVAGG